MDHDRLVRAYFKMKAKRAELKAAYEAEDNKVKDDMETVENMLLGSLLENKVKSMGAADGTFYLETKVMPNCTDWLEYRRWMVANDALDGVEKRVSKGFIVDFMKTHEDDVPPGIAVFKEQVVRIRAKN